jgi:hypothetical protein
MAYENPPFDVVERDGQFELRRYGEYIVAEVVLDGDHDSTLSSGFRILADYIFGNNRQSRHIAMTVPVTGQQSLESEKIAMTAPVTAQADHAGKYRIAFMMPSNYTMDTLPTPVDGRIGFRVVQAHDVAASRFSGNLNEASGLKHWNELQEWMSRKGIAPAGLPVYAHYSPPWIPPFLRRNEIMVDVSLPSHV